LRSLYSRINCLIIQQQTKIGVALINNAKALINLVLDNNKRLVLIIKRSATSDEKQKVEISIPITAYFCNSPMILINTPVIGCSKDGGSGHYAKNIEKE
jgi:hypothetical protein